MLNLFGAWEELQVTENKPLKQVCGLESEVAPLHAVKAYRAVEVQLHSFLAPRLRMELYFHPLYTLTAWTGATLCSSSNSLVVLFLSTCSLCHCLDNIQSPFPWRLEPTLFQQTADGKPSHTSDACVTSKASFVCWQSLFEPFIFLRCYYSNRVKGHTITRLCRHRWEVEA
jgi:hypothetical protein